MRKVGLVAIIFLVSGFSGCAGLFGADTTGDLTRSMTFILNEDAMMDLEDAETIEDAMEALGTATYTYTHRDGTLKTSDATVSYIAASGRAVETELSKFTNADELEAGDSVVIDDVAVYSAIEISIDGTTAAARGTSQPAWFTVNDVPMPFASKGVSATWEYVQSATSSFAMDGFSGSNEWSYTDDYCMYDWETGESSTCEEYESETFAIEDPSASMEITSTTILSMNVRDDGSGQKISIEADASTTATADASVDYEFTEYYRTTSEGEITEEYSDEQSGEAGFSLSDAEITMNGVVDFFTNSAGEITEVGAGGSIFVDAYPVIWYEDHPRSEGWGGDIDHPILDEEVEYMTEQVEPEELEPEDLEIVEMLASAYAMDLRVGDEFHIEVDAGDMDDVGFVSFRYDLVVVTSEAKSVGAGSIESLRLAGESSITYEIDGESNELTFSGLTVWLAKDGYFPVAADVSYAKTIDMNELQPVIDAIEESMTDDEAVFIPPTFINFAAGFATTIELTAYKGDLTMAAPLVIGTMFSGPASFMGSAFAGMMSPGSMYDEEYYYEPCYYDEDDNWVCQEY